MTIVNGTSGYDYLDVQGAGDFEVFAGSGDDLIALRKQSYQPGTVTLDAGDGADKITIQIYGTQSVTAHGGTGNDVFDLISGGVAYGDAGSDTFSINGLAGGGKPFVIADFASEDRIDLTPFLKTGTGWVDGTNPFTANFARLAQLGSDTVLQVNWGSVGWWTLGSLKGVAAASLTAAQMGFAPKVEPITFVTINSPTASVMEGSKITLDFTLSAPLTSSVSVSFSFVGRGPSLYSASNASVVIEAGQTQARFTFNSYEDQSTGAGTYEFSFNASSAFIDPRPGGGFRTIEITDNDTNGFSVVANSAQTLYQNLTFLSATRPQDANPLSALGTSLLFKATRDMVQSIAPFAASTTSVAVLSYEFFTGKTPTQVGVDFLISATGPNPNNLNSIYYAQFNTVNRFINFAVNLGKNGEAKDAFAAKYGAMTLFDATRDAYRTIFGATPTDEKLHVLLDSRTDYLAYYGGDGSAGIGTKAAMVGFLLAAAATENTGTYARALENFYIDLADGSAQFHVDLIGVYGPGTFLDSMT